MSVSVTDKGMSWRRGCCLKWCVEAFLAQPISGGLLCAAWTEDAREGDGGVSGVGEKEWMSGLQRIQEDERAGRGRTEAAACCGVVECGSE